MNVVRTLSVVAALFGLTATAVTLAPAQAEPAEERAARIALPDGFQPEGITTDGRRFLYVGSLDDGAIWRINASTGAGRLLAEGSAPRAAAGLEYDRRCGRILAAGAETHRIRLHDARTGERLRTYGFGARDRFLNDVAVTPWGIYATDSINPALAVVRFAENPRKRCNLPAQSARTLRLSGQLDMQPGFNLNGLVRWDRYLVSVQTNTGNLFRIDPFTGETRRIRVRGGSLLNGDGLERGRKNVLHVVRNQDERVAVVRLNRALTRARVVSQIASASFDVPTTAARLNGGLYVVNARFGTTPEPETPYWVSKIRSR